MEEAEAYETPLECDLFSVGRHVHAMSRQDDDEDSIRMIQEAEARKAGSRGVKAGPPMPSAPGGMPFVPPFMPPPYWPPPPPPAMAGRPPAGMPTGGWAPPSRTRDTTLNPPG